jgi:DEAD/DEAH box helicase domain-containing protein
VHRESREISGFETSQAGTIPAFLEAIKQDDALRGAWRHHEVLPGRDARCAELPARYQGFASMLVSRGIRTIYAHQARALELLDRGSNVVLSTPTASGKTLVYSLSVLRRLREEGAESPSRTLCLFPLRALERDQRDRLEADARSAGCSPDGLVEIYDGDTPTGARRRIRERPPRVLISTPDMLHAGILPRHPRWKEFFSTLELIVLDELHTYRGVFGAHVAQVMRRLMRIAREHGASPRVVATSATVANPGELATKLCGAPFEVIEEDGSPRPRRHVVLMNPSASPYTTAARLFRTAVGQGLRTIAFTKARRVTELMYAWIVEAEPRLRDRVSSYRAGFLAEERREIESRLFSGDLLGVISTSALEMGIDVGGLDVCILVGYPGSQVSTWQRGGRVGRAREGAIVLVAAPDALDQYLVAHPRMLFERGYEAAVVDPHNREVAAAHFPCAADEIPLRRGETWLREDAARDNLVHLEERGLLLRSEAGEEWFPARRLPHRNVNLRHAGSSYEIEVEGEGERGRRIGTIGAGRVFAECHEGAIYLHRGRQFLVRELDTETKRVVVRAVNVSWFTRSLSSKETEILSRDEARPVGNIRLVRGRLRVTTTISGFERRRVHGQDLISSEALDLPPTSIETTGLWLEIPDEIPALLRNASHHPMGGLHAVEHAALSLFPLFALCDRNDVGGITTLAHPQVGRGAIFLYDGQDGGLGLASGLFSRLETLLEATLEMIADCPCETGCPACVHSPKCGNGNRPIDKAGAERALRLILAQEALPTPIVETSVATVDAPAPLKTASPAASARPRMVFFDLETQRSAEEVGGWHNAHLMRVALAVTFDTATGIFETWREAQVAGLIERLSNTELVVGFNIKGFDYRVLRGYSEADFSKLPTFDLLEAIHRRIGFRLPLAHLATENLGTSKSADGLQSLRWWKQGRIEEIEKYCQNDVELLRNLFEHACAERHLLFRTKGGDRVRIPTPWVPKELLEAARGDTRRRAARPV